MSNLLHDAIGLFKHNFTVLFLCVLWTIASAYIRSVGLMPTTFVGEFLAEAAIFVSVGLCMLAAKRLDQKPSSARSASHDKLNRSQAQ